MGMLSFGKLESLSGARLTGFFALFLARIAFEMTGFFEYNSGFRVVFFECPGKAVADRSGLSIGAAATDSDNGVELFFALDRPQWGDRGPGKTVVVAVFSQGFAVDGYFALAAGVQAYAGGSRFAAAGGPDKIGLFSFGGHFILYISTTDYADIHR